MLRMVFLKNVTFVCDDEIPFIIYFQLFLLQDKPILRSTPLKTHHDQINPPRTGHVASGRASSRWQPRRPHSTRRRLLRLWIKHDLLCIRVAIMLHGGIHCVSR